MSLPDPALVLLIGASGAGKSTWAAERYLPEEVVSSDRLRAVVGSGEGDLDASADAFTILRRIVEARVGRRLTTVVDTLGLDDGLRSDCLRWAAGAGVPAVAVVFDTPLATCRERNRGRLRPVPAEVLRSQHRRAADLAPGLAGEGWQVVRASTSASVDEPAAASVPAEPPRRGGFVLHLSRFGSGFTAERLTEIATAAEDVGFAGISLMDHLIQIPQVGRRWEDIPEPLTALAFLAGVTRRVALGPLVANVTLRSIGLLAKTVATLDVLSEGRAFCGIGAGWNSAEERAYGYAETTTRRRLDALEDAVALLPRLWGKGEVTFSGRTTEVSGAPTYPRPLQERVPIVVGGGGERRTLKIAAASADAVNVMGDLETLTAKRAVLDAHCADVGRDPSEVELTVLDVTLVGDDRRRVADLVEAHRGRTPAATYAGRVNAGTVDRQVERYRALFAAGVGRAFVALPDLEGSEQVMRFGQVIEGVAAPNG